MIDTAEVLLIAFNECEDCCIGTRLPVFRPCWTIWEVSQSRCAIEGTSPCSLQSVSRRDLRGCSTRVS